MNAGSFSWRPPALPTRTTPTTSGRPAKWSTSATARSGNWRGIDRNTRNRFGGSGPPERPRHWPALPARRPPLYPAPGAVKWHREDLHVDTPLVHLFQAAVYID